MDFSKIENFFFLKGDSCQQDQSKVRKRIKLVGQNQSVLMYTNQKSKIQGLARISISNHPSLDLSRLKSPAASLLYGFIFKIF